MAISSRKEGEMWISKLKDEAEALQTDLVAVGHMVSGVTHNTIRYSLDKTLEIIQEIELEMMLIDE